MKRGNWLADGFADAVREEPRSLVGDLRFQARLAWTHPFPNGEGRHVRPVADLAARALGGGRFSWGGGGRVDANTRRKTCIDAVRAGDRHELATGRAFAQS